MINIAIVGATGLVGRTFLKVLEERNLSEFNYTLFASKKSAGKTIKFFNKDYIVEELSETSLIIIDLILLSFLQVLLQVKNLHHLQLARGQ